MAGRRTALWAFALLWIGATVARAGTYDRWLQSVLDQACQGKRSALRKTVSDGTYERVVHDPEAFLRLAMELEERIQPVALRGDEHVQELVDRMLEQAEALAKGKEDTFRPGWVRLTLIAAQQEVRAARGDKPDLEAWAPAVQAAYALKDDLTQNVRCSRQLVRWLDELAAYRTSDAAALLQQSETVLNALEKARPADTDVLLLRGLHFVRAARALARHGDVRGAKAQVEQGLKFVDAKASGGQVSQRLGVVRAALVTVADREHIHVKVSYRTVAHESRQGLLHCQVPDNALWRRTHAGTDQQILTVAEDCPEGPTSRLLTASALRFGTTYNINHLDTSIRAEDAKAVLEAMVTGVRQDGFVKVESVSHPRHGYLVRRGARGMQCVVEGTDKDGRHKRETLTVVPSKKLKHIFVFHVVEYEVSDRGLEPWEAFLRSLDIPR
jgi:hypothetical protein